MNLSQYQLKQCFLGRVILGHVHMWINGHIKQKDGDIPDLCHKLKFEGYKSKTINRFDESEADILREIGDREDFQELKTKPISLIVMALEVVRIWVEDIPAEERCVKMNISDKKLLIGKNIYFRYMMGAKRRNKELYDNQKKIIEETSTHAQSWYNYMKEALFEGVEKEPKNEAKRS